MFDGAILLKYQNNAKSLNFVVMNIFKNIRLIAIYCIFFQSVSINAQWSPTLMTANRGITPPLVSGNACGPTNNPPACPTYNVTGMNWYLTAPDPARPITIQYSSLGNHDWVMTMPSGFIEWEDPDGLACVNSEVINVSGLGPVQMNFAAVKFGSDNATSDGHVNFGYRVNGGAWTVSPNFSIAGTNTGGSWTQSATGNTIGIRACADFGGQSQDTRLTVFNTNKGAPLPVRWLGIFSSLDKERRVHLSWSTASEVNNDFFEVQRSMDENRYETIGEVKGAGNTSDRSQYTFIDETAIPGNTYYYRVKQVDFDGQTDYSIPLKVVVTSMTIGIRISSNPVEDILRMDIDKLPDFPAEVYIYSMQGQLLISKVLDDTQSVVELDISQLPPGAYFVSSNVMEFKPIKIIKVGQE